MPTVKLQVRVTPRASRDEICDWNGEQLNVKVTAPPVKGAANEAIIKLLAQVLKVRARDISVISGHNGRNKLLSISGCPASQLHKRLQQAVGK
jgi:uncharacterized protein (TIGR00251 family)